MTLSSIAIKKESLFRRLTKNTQIYLMLLPNLIIFISLVIYPVIWALQYMFLSYNGFGAAKFVGIDHFIRIFTRDQEFWKTGINTLIYVGGKILFTLPLSFALAIILNKKLKGKSFIRGIIFAPTILSSAVMALIFYLLFNVYNGEINRFLLNTGIIKQPINWLGKDYAMLTCIIVAAWAAVGNYMIYFISGLQSIPAEIYESAELDGINNIQRMIFITIPMMGPILQIIIMIALIQAFQDMQSIMVLTGGGPFSSTKVVFLYIYQQYFPIDPSQGGSSEMTDFGYGAALSIVTAIIIGLITYLYLYLSRKFKDLY